MFGSGNASEPRLRNWEPISRVGLPLGRSRHSLTSLDSVPEGSPSHDSLLDASCSPDSRRKPSTVFRLSLADEGVSLNPQSRPNTRPDEIILTDLMIQVASYLTHFVSRRQPTLPILSPAGSPLYPSLAPRAFVRP